MEVLKRRRVRLRLAVFLLLPAALLTCRVPPFDEGLSLGLKTARRMNEVAWIGPVESRAGEDREGWWFRFFPDEDTYATGFVAEFQNRKARVLYWDGSRGSQDTEVYLGAGGAEAAPRWRAVATGPPGARTLVLIGHNYPSGVWVAKQYDPFVQVLFDAAGPLDLATDVENQLGLGGEAKVWASDFYPDASPLQEGAYVLYFDVSNGQLAEADGTAQAAGLVLGGTSGPITGTPITQFSEPEVVDRGRRHYHRNQDTGTRHLNRWTGAGWRTLRWEAGLGAETMDLSLEIRTVLSTGELFCVSDNIATVCAPDGRKKYSFPLGDLRLVEERYDGGVPTLVFVLPVFTYHDGDDELELGVYTIETALLETLD